MHLFRATVYLCICFQLLYLCPCCFEGRRRSRVSFLKVYIVASTVATLLWIAYVAKSNFALEVRWLNFFFNVDYHWELQKQSWKINMNIWFPKKKDNIFKKSSKISLEKQDRDTLKNCKWVFDDLMKFFN